VGKNTDDGVILERSALGASAPTSAAAWGAFAPKPHQEHEKHLLRKKGLKLLKKKGTRKSKSGRNPIDRKGHHHWHHHKHHQKGQGRKGAGGSQVDQLLDNMQDRTMATQLQGFMSAVNSGNGAALDSVIGSYEAGTKGEGLKKGQKQIHKTNEVFISRSEGGGEAYDAVSS